MSEITRKSFFVSASGGVLDFVRDGEVLASIAVPPGRVNALQYLELCPDGAEIQISNGLAVLDRASRIGVQSYGSGSHDSGANPDFKPTSASRAELEMRLLLNKLGAQSRSMDARLKALASIERVPENPVVVEPLPEKTEPAEKPVVE